MAKATWLRTVSTLRPSALHYPKHLKDETSSFCNLCTVVGCAVIVPIFHDHCKRCVCLFSELDARFGCYVKAHTIAGGKKNSLSQLSQLHAGGGPRA